jgi:hypothetical protein
MGTISLSLPADGTTADVADVNTPFTTIANAINGNLDNSNLSASAAIDGNKLAAGSVPTSKLSTTAGDIGGAWAAYTPVLTATTTSPNIGSTGTIVGRYTQIGKTVHFEVQVQVSGTGITAGSGNYMISLPVAAQATGITANAFKFVGNTNVYQSSGTINFLGMTQLNQSTTFQVVLWTLTTLSSGGVLALGVWGSGVVPIATGNILTITGTYEAA